MSPTAGSVPRRTTTHSLQGIGAWALEVAYRADCDKTKGTEVSPKLQVNSSPELSGKHGSAGDGPRRGQKSRRTMDLRAEVRDLERQLRCGNLRERHSDHTRPTTTNDWTSTTQSNSADNKMPSASELRQVRLHRYLSAPARCDPWHGMGEIPEFGSQTLGERKARQIRGTSPSSLRVELGGNGSESEKHAIAAGAQEARGQT